MSKSKQKPPMACKTLSELSDRDDLGDFYIGGKEHATAKVYCYEKIVVISSLDHDETVEVPRADFDAMVRWYTGLPQPRAKKARAQ